MNRDQPAPRVTRPPRRHGSKEPEYFGPDCSLRRCPSGDDPHSTADETDCEGKTAAGGHGTGLAGNKCHVDCSNRGLCDYDGGLCTCYPGFIGDNCAKQSNLY